MSKGGLAFLNKKSWHTPTFHNVERVWKAEEKKKEETKKLEQLRKEKEEERQVEELKRLQKDSGLVTNSSDKLDWMYMGIGGGANSNEQSEEYLKGKVFKPDKLDEDVNKLNKNPGGLFLQEGINEVLEEKTRLREDPMLNIKSEENKRRLDIIKNPLKMKKIKEELALMEKLKKTMKKAKKEMRKVKKDKKDKKDKKKRQEERQ